MSHTFGEIQQQPYTWEHTIAATREQWLRIAPSLAIEPATHFVCVGSGTSLYLAQSAAHAFQEVTQHVASAVPNSEIFLSPPSTVPPHVPVVAFVISRSGTTSEALIAAEYLRTHCPHVQVVGLTCNHDTALARAAHHVIELPHATERSVVMTQSFTNMLLALQVVAGLIAGNDRLLEDLSMLPSLLRQHMPLFDTLAKQVGEDLRLQRFIYLGLGPNYGLAQEGTLKLKEMTQTPCEAYNPLEFRHGPISIVDEGTVVILLEAQREHAYSDDVVADVKQHGAHVVAVGPYHPTLADTSVELPLGVGDIARCVLYLPPLQLIAYYRALALGLDPDQPRHLNQVVVLHAH